MQKLEIFNYEGNEVTFKAENGETYINATEMAKPFGKKTKDWLKLNSTREFLQMLENQKGEDHPISDNQIVMQKQGTPDFGGGTWMHEDAALEFARWLSPYFAKWTNDRIKELMKYGVTATPEAIEKALTSPDAMIKVLEALRDERKQKEIFQQQKEYFKQQSEFAQEIIEIQKPAVDYTKKVLQSESLYTTTLIAKELGMSAVTLNRKLKGKGIQYKHNGVWVLYTKYQNKEYTKTKTTTIEKDGITKTYTHTYWTERGRAWLHSEFNKNFLMPIEASQWMDHF